MNWINVGLGLCALVMIGSVTMLVISESEDRRIDVRQEIATNNAEKAQQLVDDMVFVRRKNTDDCFLVRADVYNGRGWASLDGIVIPVSCDGKH